MSLSKQEIGTIIIRVIGIFALIRALEYFTQILPMVQFYRDEINGVNEIDVSSVLFFFATFLPLITVGIWFLFSAKTLGAGLVGQTKESSETTAVSAKEWEEIALSIIGLYLLFSNISRIPNLINLIVIHEQFDRPFPASELITVTLMLLLSTWLILRAKGLIAVIHKLRYAGLKK